MKSAEFWKDFKVSLRIRTENPSSRRRVRDIAVEFDFTYAISPPIMQFIFTENFSTFKDYMESKGYSLDGKKSPIEITRVSAKRTLENIEVHGDELCDVISCFTIGYDIRAIAVLPGMDEYTFDSILSSFNLAVTWDKEKNCLCICGEHLQVEKAYQEIQEKYSDLWTYSRGVFIDLNKEDEKNMHITVSTDVTSPIVRQCSLTIHVIPYLYNCTPILNMVTAGVLRPAMEDANTKRVKEELKQPTLSTLEALCLSVLNSFISVACGYICRPLMVSQEIQEDVKTKLTRFGDLSFVWHVDDNLLWVCSTREKFQSRFEELMKIVHDSKVQMEYAQVPLLTEDEKEDSMVEKTIWMPPKGNLESEIKECDNPTSNPSHQSCDETTAIHGIDEDTYKTMLQYFGQEETWITIQPRWLNDKVVISTSTQGARAYFEKKCHELSLMKDDNSIPQSYLFPKHNQRFQTESEECESDSKLTTSSYERRVDSGDEKHLAGINLSTEEGLLLKVYRADILSLDVECIVNASNENLRHGGGVSLVISNAAGPDMDKECEWFIEKNGPLKVGTCCTTTAGHLTRYRCVIHTVGPRWSDFKDKEKCREKLRQSIYGCLQEATYKNVKSIGFPPVSTGIFGMPKNFCAEDYLSAVLEFSSHYGCQTKLREIHFIDVDVDTIRLIQSVFVSRLKGSTKTTRITKVITSFAIKVRGVSSRTTLDTVEFYFDNKRRSGGGGVTNVRQAKEDGEFLVTFNNEEAMKSVLQRKHTLDGGQLDVKPCINTNAETIPNHGAFSVQIYVGNITKVNVDCIVNSTNEQLMHGGGVAAAISEAAGYALDKESKDFISRNGPLPVGKCCVTTAGKLPYKFVIHTVGPRWSDYSNEDKAYCVEDLQEALEVTFKEADKLEMKSIALPAISSGIFGVPKETCAESYYKAVCGFLASYARQSLQEIHFVDRDPNMVSEIQKAFGDFDSI